MRFSIVAHNERVHVFDATSMPPRYVTSVKLREQPGWVTFSMDGKQYVAVTTGNGGGSPRAVPATIAPELHPPATGNALYVFALPDRR